MCRVKVRATPAPSPRLAMGWRGSLLSFQPRQEASEVQLHMVVTEVDDIAKHAAVGPSLCREQ